MRSGQTLLRPLGYGGQAFSPRLCQRSSVGRCSSASSRLGPLDLQFEVGQVRVASVAVE